MKGLEEYIKVHGNHFTEELAHDVCRSRWSTFQIKESAQKLVYYNVTGSTDGDMVYLTDMVYRQLRPSGGASLRRCIKPVLMWVEDYNKTGSPFCIWLSMKVVKEEDFDFTPYI